MLYQFKHSPSDFIVDEILAAQPSGNGDVFYVYFQKENLTTMEVLEHLQRQLGLFREDFGIAGLKDKMGITRQWITVFHSALERAWWRDKFLSSLWEVVKILETTRGENPLRIGGNVGNIFEVRLRARNPHPFRSSPWKGDIFTEKKELIEANIEKVKKNGFPNCFGYQRFGKGYKNFWEAKEVISSVENPLSLPMDSVVTRTGWNQAPLWKRVAYHLRFMLQAYPSMYFNEYVMNRWEKWQQQLQGDIMIDRYYASGARVGVYQDQEVRLFDYKKLKEKYVEEGFFDPPLLINHGKGKTFPYIFSAEETTRIPTWPMLGWNLLLAPSGSKARVRDDQLLELAEFDEHALEVCKTYQLWGLRRPLWVFLHDLQWSWEGDDLLLHFSLPTGSYATVLLAFILEGVDSLTLRENKLEIPRIEKNRQL